VLVEVNQRFRAESGLFAVIGSGSCKPGISSHHEDPVRDQAWIEENRVERVVPATREGFAPEGP